MILRIEGRRKKFEFLTRLTTRVIKRKYDVVSYLFLLGGTSAFISILYFEYLIACGPAKGIFSCPRNYSKVYY
ncbi:hypothetical protein GYH30_041720 [Glycine max]|uniref:Uncharacterized protein n=1 Tax=Glycine max TaxID=3847 RepID=A0A0R0FXX0_SOYBN|nr:hypothetical protein GYH30_041720 [Glycine max]